jgi:hypothetical protein
VQANPEPPGESLREAQGISLRGHGKGDCENRPYKETIEFNAITCFCTGDSRNRPSGICKARQLCYTALVCTFLNWLYRLIYAVCEPLRCYTYLDWLPGFSALYHYTIFVMASIIHHR